MKFDLLFRGGWVIDGSGGPPFRADVAIVESVVAALGRLEGAEAAKVVDVNDLYVRPDSLTRMSTATWRSWPIPSISPRFAKE